MANILIVDDDLVVLKIVETTLKAAGHAVTTAENGHDAFEKLMKQPFNLVISDANMPGGVSGFDLAATVRKEQSLKDLAVMLLTGRREKHDVVRAMKSGVDDYLVKPVDPALLLAKVEMLLEKRPGAFSFAETAVRSPGTLKVDFTVVGISELGVTLISGFAIGVNSKLKVDCDLFKKMNIEPPMLRVSSCGPAEASGESFKITTSFIGLGSAELQAIRVWIQANSTRIAKNAA